MNYLPLQLSEARPIGSVEENGERSHVLFSDSWPVVFRLIRLAVDAEVNKNVGIDDCFPDTSMMTSAAAIESIEYGADYRGEPVATFLVRCAKVGGGYYMQIEIVAGVASDGESVMIRDVKSSEL